MGKYLFADFSFRTQCVCAGWTWVPTALKPFRTTCCPAWTVVRCSTWTWAKTRWTPCRRDGCIARCAFWMSGAIGCRVRPANLCSSSATTRSLENFSSQGETFGIARAGSRRSCLSLQVGSLSMELLPTTWARVQTDQIYVILVKWFYSKKLCDFQMCDYIKSHFQFIACFFVIFLQIKT